MNPIFEGADSYQKNDTWRQGYNRDIAKIFKASGNVLNKWQPLGLWSAPRYYGKYINIGKYNLRRTITKNKRKSEKSEIKIDFFGGSLVWGWNVRDESTIPSQLLSLRNNANIENHGQLGYVSSQSLIAFIQRIKNGRKPPDVVIFMDGFNDIYSAYQSKVAGIEQNAISRKQQLELKVPKDMLEFYWHNSKFIKILKLIFFRKRTKVRHGNQNKRLARSIIDIYNKNIDLIHLIASSHNIKVLCIWPPTIFDKPNLTTYEQKIFKILNCFQPLYASVKGIIQTDGALDQRVVNLSDLFANEKAPTYCDPWHYNEYANTLIAKKIHDTLPKPQ